MYIFRHGASLVGMSPTSSDLHEHYHSLYNQSSSLFDQLSNEVVIEILLLARKATSQAGPVEEPFLALPLNAIGVCKRWRNLILGTPDFWTQIVVTDTTSDERLQTHLSRSKAVPVHLWLDFSLSSRPWGLPSLSLCVDKAASLCLLDALPSASHIRPRSAAIHDLSASLPRLKRLHVGGNKRTNHIFYPSTGAFVLPHPTIHFHRIPAHSLQILTCHRCRLSSGSLASFLKQVEANIRIIRLNKISLVPESCEWKDMNMSQLEELEMTGESFEGFATGILSHLSSPNLRCLSMDLEGDTLDKDVKIHSYPELESLHLQLAAHPDVLRDILSSSPNLLHLSTPTTWTIQLPDRRSALDIVHEYGSGGLRKLQSLKVSDYTPVRLRRVLTLMPTLKQVDISDAVLIPSDRLVDVEEVFGRQGVWSRQLRVAFARITGREGYME